MQNELSSLVLQYLGIRPRTKDLFKSFSEQTEYDVVGSLLGQAYSGSYEWYIGPAHKDSRGNATFRIHAKNKYNFLECYKQLGMLIPAKFYQLGSKELILFIDKCLRDNNLQSFPLDQRYSQFSVDRTAVSPMQFASAIGLHERSIKSFEQSICCLPVFSIKSVVNTPKVQKLMEYDEYSFNNECLCSTKEDIGDVWEYRKSVSNSKIDTIKKKVENPICFMKNNCRHNTGIHDSNGVLNTVTVFFGKNTPSYEHYKTIYAGRPKDWQKIDNAAAVLQSSLTEEHFVSKHECQNMGIDPDFPGNVLLCCKWCNSSLSNKSCVDKLNIIAKSHGNRSAYNLLNQITCGIESMGNSYFRWAQHIRIKAHKEMPNIFVEIS